MSRAILDLLGITEEDVKNYYYWSKRRLYRQFLRKGRWFARIRKGKRDAASLYYNIMFWYTSAEMCRTYNAIEDENDSLNMRKNIVRVEYCTARSHMGSVIYLDAREMACVLQDMWYIIQVPNRLWVEKTDTKPKRWYTYKKPSEYKALKEEKMKKIVVKSKRMLTKKNKAALLNKINNKHGRQWDQREE